MWSGVDSVMWCVEALRGVACCCGVVYGPVCTRLFFTLRASRPLETMPYRDLMAWLCKEECNELLCLVEPLKRCTHGVVQAYEKADVELSSCPEKTARRRKTASHQLAMTQWGRRRIQFVSCDADQGHTLLSSSIWYRPLWTTLKLLHHERWPLPHAYTYHIRHIVSPHFLTTAEELQAWREHYAPDNLVFVRGLSLHFDASSGDLNSSDGLFVTSWSLRTPSRDIDRATTTARTVCTCTSHLHDDSSSTPRWPPRNRSRNRSGSALESHQPAQWTVQPVEYDITDGNSIKAFRGVNVSLDAEAQALQEEDGSYADARWLEVMEEKLVLSQHYSRAEYAVNAVGRSMSPFKQPTAGRTETTHRVQRALRLKHAAQAARQRQTGGVSVASHRGSAGATAAQRAVQPR